MGQVVPTNEGQSLDLVQAGAVALTGLTGTLLVSAGHQCQGKRQERQNSPLFGLVLLSPEPQKWWPSTWPRWDGQGVHDLLGKAQFGQENCYRRWIFMQT